MRRSLLQFTVVLAMFAVAANVVCSANCLVASCAPASESGSTEDDHGCHHHDDPTAPTHTDEACSHAQLLANDSVRISIPLLAYGMFQAEAPEAIPVGIELIASARFAYNSPPPLSADVVSTTVLRV